MKSFIFTDRYGNQHSLPPSFFASSPLIKDLDFLDILSDSVRLDLSAYAVKAFNFIHSRRSRSDTRRKLYAGLFGSLYDIYMRNFDNVSFLYVMRVYSVVVHAEIYRSHYALRRGYCLKAHRNFATVDFYFGYFGGGWYAYDFFTTQYRKIGIFTFTDYWFLNGDVDFAKIEAFRDWCVIVSDNFLDNVDSILKI